MMRIAIAGIGGVGGYFGGMLAKHFQHSEEVEIVFIARGENEKAIRENGLRMETTQGNFTVFPKIVSSHPDEIGKPDLLICCTKSYDLENTLLGLSACVKPETVFLPLLNGVDSSARIRKLFPENTCWDGCVYLVARLIAPGILKETGGIARLFFGMENGNTELLRKTESIFKAAGIEAAFHENIHAVIWEKFVFISCIATITSYANLIFGPMLKDENCRKQIELLLDEVYSLAKAKAIGLPEDIIPKTLKKIYALPDDTTSSMHSDFQKGKETELESITGYVVNEARLLHLNLPVFEMMYAELKSRKTNSANS